MHIRTALFKYCTSVDLDRNVNAVSHTHTHTHTHILLSHWFQITVRGHVITELV